MAEIKRVGTFKPSKRETAAIVQIGDVEVIITHADKDFSLNTEAKFRAELIRVVGNKPPVFVHFNRDGSVAIATGKEPDVWPEDITDARNI